MTVTAAELRTAPRLWVEKVWLLRSLDDMEPYRTVDLGLGINLIVSPPSQGSSGHGVGKTAFCQLLRFVLDDSQAWEGTDLHDELRYSLPNGAVAARVHVGGQSWTVLKPWTHQKRYRASRDADWSALTGETDEGGYAAYQAALQQHLVDCLPVRDLPGTSQRIEWRHLLAWCSRDQNARYKSYYAWREKGVGFSQPGKAPALVVRVVLGILQDTATLREIEVQDRLANAATAELEVLKRQPTDLREHVRLQLSRILRAPTASRFRSTDLMEVSGLAAMAKQTDARYQQELADIQAELGALEADRADTLTRRAPVIAAINQLANQAKQCEAAIADNDEELLRLQKEPDALQQRGHVFCESGYRKLSDCNYVQERIGTLQIDRAQGTASRNEAIAEHQQRLTRLNNAVAGYRAQCQPLDEALERLSKNIREQTQGQLAVLRDVQRLADAIEEFQHYEDVIAGKTQWAGEAAAQTRRDAALTNLSQLELKQRQEEDAGKARRKMIDTLAHEVANDLPGFSWGVFNDSEDSHPRPFRLGPSHSTTFSVLETLFGDVVCLLDNTNPQSFHPGFLLHDSPREAEMSESLLWAMVAAAKLRGGQDMQYIVTTSTTAPESLRDAIRLELHTRDESGLLLGQKLGPGDQALLGNAV